MFKEARDLENRMEKEFNKLIDSINIQLRKTDIIRNKFKDEITESYPFYHLETISYDCYSDYSHDQYALILNSDFEIQVGLIGCGNSEVDNSDIDSCISSAMQSASIRDLESAYKYLTEVNENINRLS